ncbi:MAG: heparinase II/III family protein [Tepidisphaeraceae bacterium]
MTKSYRQLVSMLLIGCCASVSMAKDKQTYYRPEEVAAIRERAKQPQYKAEVAATLKAADVIADRSDEDLWNLVPPADLIRALNVRYTMDCPIHGEEIHRKAGRFPWITDPNKPFKIECPVGHETYPSNDFDAYLKAGRKEKLDTHAKYVDDGTGWLDEKGNRYFFVGYYNFWTRWRKELIDGIGSCGNAYLLTGDPKYAHKAAIALAAISRVYPQMDYSTQAYHNGKWPAGINGRILDYIWENQTVRNFAVAYDQIYPTLDADAALQQLAAKNGVPDVKAAIEKNILQEMASDLLAKKIWGNRSELNSIATVATVIQNDDASKGITSKQMADYLMKGGGELEFSFYNGVDRDGWGCESSLGYSLIGTSAATMATDELARSGLATMTDPKWLKMIKAPIHMRLLDDLVPRLGDFNGHIKGTNRTLSNDLFMVGVSRFNDPECARALLRSGSFKPPLLSRTLLDDEKLKSLASQSDRFPSPPYTRDLGGYGLAILELNDGAATRSATMYYGSPYASHGHADRLTMSFHQDDRDLFTELGYPSSWGADAGYWVKNTPSHYCVLIDEKPQAAPFAGYLTRFADLDGLKFAEAQGKDVWNHSLPPPPVPVGSIGGEKDRAAPPPPPTEPYKPTVDDYRRMLGLLDTGEKSTLLVEAFLVQGGQQHDYAFHGLPYGEFAIDAKNTRSQNTGTLAGESVEVGIDPKNGKASSGYQFLAKPRWFEPAGATHVSWTNDNGYNLNTWFPKLSIDEIVVADGTLPVYPGWPATMPFILLRHHGDAVSTRSLFLSISEGGKTATAVKSVRPIHAKSLEAGGASITLASGTTVNIYVNGGATEAEFDDGSRATAPFTIVRSPVNGNASAVAVGNGKFQGERLAIDVPAPAPMTVQSVDYKTNSVLVSGQPPALGKFGTVLFATRPPQPLHASYTVRSIEPTSSGTKLSFGDTPLIAGRYEASWDAVKKQIVSKEPTSGVYNRLVASPYVGMSVVSEDLSTTALITAYDRANNSFTIDADDVTATKFTDADGDGHAYVYLAEFAPGVTLTPTASGRSGTVKARTSK